jgi:hypothetical protein
MPANSMLLNTVLYYASTGAQVWSALVVFVILQLREYARERALDHDGIIAAARSNWSEIVGALNDPNHLGGTHLGDYKLNNHVMYVINQSQLEQKHPHLHLIKMIAAHKLALATKSSAPELHGEPVELVQYQNFFNRLSDELESINKTRYMPACSFIIGCLGIVLNFVILKQTGNPNADVDELFHQICLWNSLLFFVLIPMIVVSLLPRKIPLFLGMES